MAAEKGRRPGILLYHDDLEALELTMHRPGESELADLVMAVYHYSEFGEIPDFEGRSVAFTRLYNRMAAKVDEQADAYRRKVEGAKKGGAAKAKKDRADSITEKGIEDAMKEIMTQSVRVGYTSMKQDEKENMRAELRAGYSVSQIVEAMKKAAASSGIKDRKAHFTSILHNL